MEIKLAPATLGMGYATGLSSSIFIGWVFREVKITEGLTQPPECVKYPERTVARRKGSTVRT